MWVRFPAIIKTVFKDIIWDLPEEKENKIYLTFDDGPEPGITPQVLAFLRKYDARATFFCLGSQIEEYPEITNQILKEGHTIGNHGYIHLNGWKTSNKNYIKNAQIGAEISNSIYFRPPYGKLSLCQYIRLKNQFKIVMWSALSMDYSKNSTPEECAKNVISNIYPGAVIVFHDTPKASANLLETLPLILQYLICEGYTFEALPNPSR